jgi:hypothetical protein
VLSSLGSEANGIILIDGWVDAEAGGPVVAQIKSDMEAVNSNDPVTTLGVITWASAKLVEEAAPQIHGPVTAASMLAALDGLRNASTGGAIPPFSAIELPIPAYKRYFNHYATDYVIQNGAVKLLNNFYDLQPYLGG